MWRALERGYEAEPLLLVVAFGLSLLSALPDALLARMAQATRRRGLGSQPRARDGFGSGIGRIGHGNVVPASRQ